VTEAALERLRAGGAARLVDLLLDDLLDRPVTELVDADRLGAQLAAAFRASARDYRLESMLRDRVRRLSPPAGKPAVPAAVTGPLREVLRRPYTPDRQLAGRLLDHETVRLLLKNLFHDGLVSFAKRLRPPVPLPMASGRLPFGGLGKLGGGVLGAVGEEVERQVEQKAREFMDHAVHRLVEKMADHLCDPMLTRDYGAFRAHLLDTILDTPSHVLVAEVNKVDPDTLVATGAAVLRGLADSPGLDGQLSRIVAAAVEQAEGRSLRGILGGTEDPGLDLVRSLLKERAAAVIETPAFAAWWDEVVVGP
jgi:hypothetical protein